MILITSASYLSSEFQSEFGKIPPSFLPLGTKRLYEYQANLFSDLADDTKHKKQNIILSLPQRFVVSDFEKAKIAKLGITPLFVPENLSLGQSITYCLNMNLPLNEPLQILHGDTYFTQFSQNTQKATAKSQNAISISKALYGYEYAKLDSHKFVLKDKIPNAQDFVLNGYFCIANPYHLIKSLLRADYDFITALKIYSQDFAFNLLQNDFWLDFGLISSYFHGKSVIFSHRHFNSVKIDSHKIFIHKTSRDTDKIRAEIEWFESLPNDLRIFTPKIYPNDDKKSYKCEYLYLNTLAEIFVFGRLNGYAYKTIFEKIAQVLDKLHSIKSPRLPQLVKGKSCNDNNICHIDTSFSHTNASFCHTERSEVSQISHKNRDISAFSKPQYDKTTGTQKSKMPNFNYAQKSAQRLSAFAKQRNFNLDKPFRFNGKIAPSLNILLETLARFISADFAPCFIHGDFCFSNICFDFRSLRLKTFDPRGLDFSGNLIVYGDKRYDVAKLAHSVLGLYDFIVFGFYECDLGESSEFYEMTFSVDISEHIKEIQRIFLESNLFDSCDKREIFAIMCHLFISMLPLHCDDKARQDAFLANAYRIYFDFLADKSTNQTPNHKKGANL